MKAGKLREKLTLQRCTTTINDAGTPLDSWADVATLPAELMRRATDDMVRTFGNASEYGMVFRTRWYADITLADRITYGGTPFTIKKLVPDPRRRSLDISIYRVAS
jgi:SPP1 family predicted phage head-tail adaptor